MRKWYANDNIMCQSVDLLAMVESHGSQFVIRAALEQVEHEDGAYIAEPTLRFSFDEAQQIMNELWRIGLRPKNGNGAVAHTEALQRHLNDMRTIAFNRLKITDGQGQEET